MSARVNAVRRAVLALRDAERAAAAELRADDQLAGDVSYDEWLSSQPDDRPRDQLDSEL